MNTPTLPQSCINLDHAATTRPEQAVVAAVVSAMLECDANPSSPYSAAGLPRRVMRNTKQLVAGAIGCQATEIYLTSGGTEANNMALHQVASKHVVLSAIEHKSVLLAAFNQGCQVTLAAPDANGRVHTDTIMAAVRPDTAMISVQYANNETGVLQPVADIGSFARSRGILFHCDAVQAVGHLAIDVNDCCIDILSASAHKLYGPRGVGFLYLREGLAASPLIAGGGQQNGLRGGTENVAAIAGLGVALELAMQDMEQRALREAALLSKLLAAVVEMGVAVLCPDSPRLPSIASLLLPIDSETAIAQLDLMGIRVSGGAACASSTGEPSHVLTAMGIGEQASRRVIRVSLGRHTTDTDIETAILAFSKLLDSPR